METIQTEKQAFEQWAVIEIFGHQRIAGKVTEQTIGGCAFIRVDVPDLPGKTVDDYGQPRSMPPIAGFTKLYGNGAIYSMAFVDEAIAKATAQQLRVMPIDSYTLRDALKAANPETLQKMLAAPDDDADQTEETLF